MTLCFAHPMPAFTQGETAVPFLLISSSPEANGMGGTAATVPSSDALAPISNPGQLGLFALGNLFSVSTYTRWTDWLPQFGLTGLNYRATALNAGYNFQDLLSIPFTLSVGIGYSNVHIDLGRFTLTSSTGPAIIRTVDSDEYSETVCAAIGMEYYARIGVGFNFKRIHSNLMPIALEQGTGSASSSATDFGLLLDVPLSGIVSDLTQTSFDTAPKTMPFLDFSVSYVKANVGGTMIYADPDQGDPLPRMATVGVGLEFGLNSSAGPSNLKLASFQMSRQADDVLVIRRQDGSFEYQSGLGDIRFVDNVILGKMNSNAFTRKGWQLQVAEVLYIRSGSVDGPGLEYSTSGYSFCLAGLLKLLGRVNPSLGEGSWVGFAAEHFDLQYHSSKYDETFSPILGTTFAALNFVVRGFEL